MKHRGVVSNDHSGRIELGLFFFIFAEIFGEDTFDNSFILIPPHSDDEIMMSVTTSIDAEKVSQGQCSRHPDRVDIERLNFATIDIKTSSYAELWSTESVVRHGMLGNRDDGFVYARKHVRDALLQADFVGTRFSPCTVVASDPLPFDPNELMLMCFDGQVIDRPHVVIPEAENYCSKCGYSPMVCKTCPEYARRCPHCDNKTFSTSELVFDWGNMDVLDFDRWDGRDFLGGSSPVITGRVLDTLLDLGVAPLGVIPLGCYVGEHDESEYAHLRSKSYPHEKEK